MGQRRIEDFTRALNHWMEIDVAALRANVSAIAGTVSPSELVAVVKANGYGHGARVVASEVLGAGADAVAVAWVAEGLLLRRQGIQGRVLVLEHVTTAEVAGAIEAGLEFTCHSAEFGHVVSAEAQRLGVTARVHVKVDTGLHRFGLPVAGAVGLAERLRGLPSVEVAGLWTHMANADEADDSFSDEQWRVFSSACEALPWIPFRHVANSATSLRRPEFRADGVRVGVALYGVTPENTPAPSLRPVLSLRSRVARVVDLEAGEGVSYGLEWRASEPSQAALVPVGYADGWRRSLGNCGSVLIRGRRVSMIGRVCMDQFLVEVTGLDVREGDVVTLLGEDGSERITADEVARLTGTIPWETLAGLGRRIPRLYVLDGRVVDEEAPV